MNIADLAACLKSDFRSGGRLDIHHRQTAIKCLDGLLAIGLEYKLRLANTGTQEIQISRIEQNMQLIVESLDSTVDRLTRMNKDLRKLLERMSSDIDVAMGFDTYVDGVGKPVTGQPKFDQKFTDKWISSRAPEWFDIPSKALTAVDCQAGVPKGNGRALTIELSNWVKLALENLAELKAERARQGVNTINPPVDQTEWLVHSVADCVRATGGKHTHVLPISQAIAGWADPECEPGMQWGRKALNRWK